MPEASSEITVNQTVNLKQLGYSYKQNIKKLSLHNRDYQKNISKKIVIKSHFIWNSNKKFYHISIGLCKKLTATNSIKDNFEYPELW